MDVTQKVDALNEAKAKKVIRGLLCYLADSSCVNHRGETCPAFKICTDAKNPRRCMDAWLELVLQEADINDSK